MWQSNHKIDVRSLTGFPRVDYFVHHTMLAA